MLAAKLDGVKTYMRMRRVPNHLQVKVIKWFDYLWLTQKCSDEEKAVSCLPGKFRLAYKCQNISRRKKYALNSLKKKKNNLELQHGLKIEKNVYDEYYSREFGASFFYRSRACVTVIFSISDL